MGQTYAKPAAKPAKPASWWDRPLYPPAQPPPDAALAAALRGWPAYLSQARLKQAMLRFRADKSLMGTRVRLIQRHGGWVEYRKLPGRALYQRADDAALPDFPAHMPAWELPRGGDAPHKVLAISPGRVKLASEAGGCCLYAFNGEVWSRGACSKSPCQVRSWEVEEAGQQDSMQEYLFSCYHTDGSHEPSCQRLRRAAKLIPYDHDALASRKVKSSSRINPGYSCTYDDPFYKADCQRLMARASADAAGIRRLG